uniref:Uncharacterized protein n=1 Tax=Vespula pensylvanica TaxID=30213 RepID=A0A834NCV1_VESPE|nr:hypothetical protein H0235_014994 [Vespula pensylvanica]
MFKGSLRDIQSEDQVMSFDRLGKTILYNISTVISTFYHPPARNGFPLEKKNEVVPRESDKVSDLRDITAELSTLAH